MSYTNTFILVAPDSARTEAAVPPMTAKGKTVARIQHELLSAFPGAFTEKELYFRVHCERHGLAAGMPEDERKKEWLKLFAKPQACMRASPLPKSYGWGVHYDEAGRITLVAVESPEYRRLSEGPLTRHFAMRSKKR